MSSTGVARDASTGSRAALRQWLLDGWWLALAATVVVSSGACARLGYAVDQVSLQNDSGWAGAVVLLSVPLLGALHVTAVRHAAGEETGVERLWPLMRVLWWPFLRLGAIAALLSTATAVLLALLGQATMGRPGLAQIALPLVATFLTFAPSALVTDPESSVSVAIARSSAWLLRRDAHRLVLASLVVTVAEVAAVNGGPHVGWVELPIRLALAVGAVILAFATSRYVVAHVDTHDLFTSLATRSIPAVRDVRPLVASGVIAIAALYVVLGAQPLVLARTGGGGGGESGQMVFASVRNEDAVPLTLTAEVDGPVGAHVTSVGFTSSPSSLMGAQQLPPADAATSITLPPGGQTNVYAVWTQPACGGSNGPLRIRVVSHLAGLTERHALPTSYSSNGSCP